MCKGSAQAIDLDRMVTVALPLDEIMIPQLPVTHRWAEQLARGATDLSHILRRYGAAEYRTAP